MDFTPLIRPVFLRRARRTDNWGSRGAAIQLEVLRRLTAAACACETGRRGDFRTLPRRGAALYTEFARRMEPCQYEDIRQDVMRMVSGEKDVLWPGVTRDFAQSSGTSGGKSKYIPITADSLHTNHYPGAADSVAAYLRLVPGSRMFAGKGMILGGSFASELHPANPGVRVGDLSATLISKVPAGASLFRIPSKKIALMPDWETKLPALVKAAVKHDVTNISGVPSWFLTVLKEMLRTTGKSNISEIWPNLEVFFHGGIAFGPYREEYARITDRSKMHFLETYNASEGFFAAQNDFLDPAMLLLLDIGIFYEFIPVGGGEPRPLWEVSAGETYELLITSCNGLWRYHLGDTVTVTSTDPVKIVIAGRTKTFINAFGEELMENNAETAIAATCRQTGASVRNYTAGPVFAGNGRRGRHEWIIEWERPPHDSAEFARILDIELQRVNSDYEAKRAHTIFLDPLTIVDAPQGLFDKWLSSEGNHKLGGQRKVPRLSNDRKIIDSLLEMIKHSRQ